MPPSLDRALQWDGCVNTRDLGGLECIDGGRTTWGAVVRSDHPGKLTPAGWDAAVAYGIRTIVSLTTDGVDLAGQVVAVVPASVDLRTVAVAVEDASDAEFARRWVDTGLWGTPLYWRDALLRWPGRHASAIEAVAVAQPGGVLIHCGRGHDRTGIITCLLLALVGVGPVAIAEDYELSEANMPAAEQAAYRQLLAQSRTTATAAIADFLRSVDIEACLGLSSSTLTRLRARLTP